MFLTLAFALGGFAQQRLPLTINLPSGATVRITSIKQTKMVGRSLVDLHPHGHNYLVDFEVIGKPRDADQGIKFNFVGGFPANASGTNSDEPDSRGRITYS